MRMTCKYVYLNVFYKNTRTDSRSRTRRETRGTCRLEAMLRFQSLWH